MAKQNMHLLYSRGKAARLGFLMSEVLVPPEDVQEVEFTVLS